MAKKTLGTAKRFGTRYGPTKKRILSEIEAKQSSRQRCPYCNKNAVRWLSVGIYGCTKCDAKFTAGAYIVEHKVLLAEAAVDDTIVEEEETIEEES